MKAVLTIIGILSAIALLDSVMSSRNDAATAPDLLAEHVPAGKSLPGAVLLPGRTDRALAHRQ